MFNQRKIKPVISSLHEYLYHRACDAFDCGTEQQYEKYINEEKEIIISKNKDLRRSTMVL